MMMFKQYIHHLYTVISDNRDLKIGLGSSATGAVSFKLGEIVNSNTLWEYVAHTGAFLSVVVTLFTLFRGFYSFRKEWRKDRLEALKQLEKIATAESKV